MDYAHYREKFFVDPPPESRFEFRGLHGATVYFSDYEAAVNYYTRVLGPPTYVEGE